MPNDAAHPRTLRAALIRAARDFPGCGIRVVGADGREEFLDYPSLLDRGEASLAGLWAHGVKAGSYVVLRITSGVEYWPAFAGCVLGGMVPLTVGALGGYDPDAPGVGALLHAWRKLGEPVVVGGSDDLEVLTRLAVRNRVVAVTELSAAGAGGDRGPGRLAGAVGQDDPVAEPADVALLQLSSGSTGTPKIMPLTHRALAENAIGAREMLDIGPSDVLLNWLPLDHSASLLLYHVAGIFLGATSVHVATELVLADPLHWLELMRRHRVTHSWAPNFGLRLVADAVAGTPDRRWDLSGVRCMVSGGEQCLPETFEAFLAATGVPAAAMRPAWGMSETATGITYASYGEPGARHRIRTASVDGDLEWATEGDAPEAVSEYLSVGRPAPGATVRIADHDGAVLPEGRIGRLQLASARVTPGYLDGPEATRLAFPHGGDWLDTGDLAFMRDGEIVITGRAKDLIILNGQNLPCHEVERVVGGVRGVRDGLVAAVGVPDPATGTESLVIFYAPDDGNPPVGRVARAVTAVVARRWQVTPAQVLAVPAAEFPRTSGGKIQRAALRRRYLAGEFAAPAHDEDSGPAVGGATASVGGRNAAPGRVEMHALVADILADLTGGPVDPAVPFYELGVGSVEMVRLRSRLERALGRRITAPTLFAHPTVQALSAHLAAAPAASSPEPIGAQTRDRRIAVIGMAARFPGADTVERYWANLLAGVDSIHCFSPDELVAAGVPAETATAPDFVAASGTLGDISGFDAGFFGITAREARMLDPQHRLFLETCHHALEDAGHPGDHPGHRTAVYAGSGMNLYPHHSYLRHQLGELAGSADPVASIGAALGNQPDFLATRVAYRLGLTGPAINVQTACSTSLVAVHLAVRALLDGEADVAVAGAVALHVPQATGYRATPGSILSARGRCRPFDADADGTVGGNGVAAVVLKPLDRALADGDRIHAVILGSAVNNDGAGKVGFTAPGVAGQVDVARRALDAAAVPAKSIGYVEAHGTGTALGDPVEHHALAEVYAGARPFLGSVKANIGHLDSCAGMAGLIKAIMTVRDARVPPQINFTRPNPAIDLSGGPFTIATSPLDWPEDSRPRRAAVSALGVGGTNAHLLVEQPPEAPPTPVGGTRVHPAPGLLPLSAADPEALRELAARYRDRLRSQPELPLADVVSTAGRGRRHLRHRLVARGSSTAALADALDGYLRGGGAGPVLVGQTGADGSSPVALAFPGQGALGTVVLDLAARFPVVRDVLDEGAEAYRRAVGGDLVARLRERPDAGTPPTDVAQPALVITGVALAELWRSWGLNPEYLLGHSVGEYAALVAAGALSLADAVTLTAHRGRLMQQDLPPGAMLAVLADTGVVEELLAGSEAEIAARNGPNQYVVSGPPAAVEALAGRAERLAAVTRRLPVDRAFHSAAVEPVLDRFRRMIEEVTVRPTRVPVVSTVDGQVRRPGWRPDGDYLCRQARQPVAHDAAARTLAAHGVATVVEAGADGVLTGIARGAGPDLRWVPSQRRDLEPADGLWQAVAELHVAGVAVNWAAVTADCGGRRTSLPAYPFQRQRFWAGTRAPVTHPAAEHASPSGAAPALAGESGSPPVASAPAAPRLEERPDPALDSALTRVLALTAERLGVDAAEVDPDQTFLQAGADSLLLMTMSREINDAFGVRLPVRDLFGAVGTPRRLAEAVLGGPSPATIPPTRPGPPTPSTLQPTDPKSAAGEPAFARPGVTPPPAPPPTAAPPLPAPLPTPQAGSAQGAPADLAAVVHRQLDLMREQLALLGGTVPTAPAPPTRPGPPPPSVAKPVPTPRPAVATPPVPATDAADTVDFSLYFFGDYADQGRDDAYEVILDAAEFADAHGFHAVWLPERHFHSFGGIFPNPSVLAAALAVRTRRLRLNAGSVVLPLHHPIRVAEEWSMVDRLSGGRIGLGCAPGWHANDFVFYPDNFPRHKQVMYENLDTVRRLWRGETLHARSGSGADTEVRLFPRPVQAEPPMFAAIVGNPDSYREAARRGLGVVTNLMTQDVPRLAENVALYRRTRADHGLDPDAGRVVVLMHTYLDEDAERARTAAFEPFCAYLRSSFSLLGQVVNSLGMNIDLADTPDDDVRFVLSRAYQRYCDQRALIGSPDSCRPVLDQVLAAGADEIACFVDFGLPAQAVRDGLPVIDTLRRATRRRLPRSGVEAADMAPLSNGQRRLWLAEQVDPGTPAYTEGAAVRLRGALDVNALRDAVQDVVDRHAPLRTTYRDVDGEPHQIIHPRLQVDLPLREHPGADEEPVVHAAMAAVSVRLFDLREGPLFAFELLRFTPTHHVLVMSFHHLVADGGSYAVLTREVSSCYQARIAGRAPHLPPLPVSYPELARDRAATDETDKHLHYWLDRLDPLPPALVLPSDRQRPAVPSAAGESLFVDFPTELTERIRQFSRAEGVTVFHTLLSAFGVMLFRFSGQPDLVVGTGTSGRDERTENLIGFFVDTLPLRLDLTGDPTFRELVTRIQAGAVDGYDHAVPFDLLVHTLAPYRQAGHHPLFDVVVEYESGDELFAFDLPGVTAKPLRIGLDKAPVDLILYLSHRETVHCHVEYRTEVFDRTTVQRFLDYVQRVLDEATRQPGDPLSHLATRLDTPTGQLCGPQREPLAERLHDPFVRQAARTPDAVAVVCGQTRWTYRELHRRAELLARRIARAGVGQDDIVAVLLPRRPELVAAQLGVLMAGAGFLPLDPTLPIARVRALLADSGARLLLTTAEIDHPTEWAHVLVEEPVDPHLPPPDRVPAPQHLAWCVYTSGSTGRPKGVVVPHRAAVDTVSWHVRALALTSADTVAHGMGLGFDANLAEIHPALAAGATVHLVPDEVRSDPAALVDEWSRHGVTVALLPAPLAELVFALPTPPPATLRTLVVGGSQLRRRPPAGFSAEVINAYGPTECSIVTTAGPVSPAGHGQIDIGTPVDNRRLHILDAAGLPVPAGAVGELCVGGAGVARGYLGRPGDTAAAFVPDPYQPGARMYRTGDLVRVRGDGTLEFIGRLDDQVKIAGHRVEPGEATAELARLPGVRQAAVIARHDRGDDAYLAAYVVPDDDDDEPADARTARLATLLAERLPQHLMPAAWVLRDDLPTTAAGKVDAARLPAPAAAPGEERPRTSQEQLVHDAWCAELGMSRLSVDVPFTAAGGHSLAAVRLANRLTALGEVKVSVHEVLRSGGIRDMAAALSPGGGDGVVDRAPATYQQELMWHRQRQAPNPPAVHMAVRMNVTGRLDLPALERAVDGLVERHAALRTRLVDRGGELIQEVLPAGPAGLPVVDLCADQLDEWCLRVGREAFPDDAGPWLRTRLARVDDETWVLMLVVHHLHGDGWSMLQLLDELGRGYAAERGGAATPPPSASSYLAYARRQRATQVAPAVLTYWRSQLAGAPRTVSLPTDRPRPVRLSGHGEEFTFDIPADLTAHLTRFAATRGSTLFPVLAAAYASLLRELTGSSDIVLACPYAHRDDRTYESVVGLFTSTLLLRPPLATAGSFTELVAGTEQAFLDAIRHQPAPLPAIYAAVDPEWRGGTPPVATMLFGMNPGMPEVDLPGLSVEVADQGLGCARRDFALVVSPFAGGLRGVVEYSTDLFDRSTVEAWSRRFLDLLAEVDG
ncbi:non-ribosomal peptide synthetase/type I polyketide synthase [Micromonospora terminaliae]|uniref:Amino acid adenylation domain-containing protein n=1 Tax=Micromonospora terminaliae TaxID=1914461 RepID=A0AAJ3DLB4_9ACTN|nr:non-ribosomal peptide synthetase/type I polyketide synthase [Micromonospora terminaliae]NES30183.1 amino acid adenylation domain-containing protein [Micromonospora terminaliae]